MITVLMSVSWQVIKINGDEKWADYNEHVKVQPLESYIFVFHMQMYPLNGIHKQAAFYTYICL